MKLKEEQIKEICLVVGYVAVICGLWLIHPSVALIIGGAGAVWFGYPGKKVK